MKTIDKGQLALALGVAVIGLFFFIGSYSLPDAGGYSTVGPAAIPRFIGAGLIVLAGFLVWESVSGGFRDHDEAAEREIKTDWAAFGWITAGIVGYGLLIERAGFVVASIVLYVLTARAFGSRRWFLNGAVALVLAMLIFVSFNYGLGLSLPSGLLAGLLP
jgi:putative tricarboxylic transport membrane protein